MSKKSQPTAVKKSFANDANISYEAKQNLDRARRVLNDPKKKPNEKDIQEAFRNLSEACSKDG